ncbi:MAG: response regulator [Elusimicrobia bacterium]|nr:response regulator [Candidatus Obscuribacterium magneticum]
MNRTEERTRPVILVVDDEPRIVENMQALLEKKGFEVVPSFSGGEGLSKLKQVGPDLIILDVMMPEIDGFQVCRQVKSNSETRSIPILLLTALNQTEEKVKGLEAGADDFLTKPFENAELLARVKAHLRAKRLHDDLKKMEQLKDSLTHMIVHDLKAPVTAINGGLGAILSRVEENGGNLTEEMKNLLNNSYTGSTKLINLVNDILDVSRLEENKFPLDKKEADIAGLVDSCLILLEPQRRKGEIEFLKNIPKDLPKVILDESIISRVLINLISNGLKFTDPGGKITVSLEPVPLEKQIKCVVEDTGSGIPDGDRDKIFDKYFQGNNLEVSRKGQGLGLSFCRMAIEAHGGKIWAENKEGKGSRFIFRLPLI